MKSQITIKKIQDLLLKALKTPYSNKKDFAKYQSPPLLIDENYQTFCGT